MSNIARGSLPFYDDPPMVQAVYAGSACKCQIVGNGTLQHPLDVSRCAMHAAAPAYAWAWAMVPEDIRERILAAADPWVADAIDAIAKATGVVDEAAGAVRPG